MKKLLSLILCLSLTAGLTAPLALAAEEAPPAGEEVWVSDPDYGDPDLCCPPEDSELDPALLPEGIGTDAAPEETLPAPDGSAGAPAETEPEETEPAGTNPDGTDPDDLPPEPADAGYVKWKDPIDAMLAGAPAEPEVMEGVLEGTDITWSVSMKTGLLTVSGTGAIPDYHDFDGNDFAPNMPWYDCRAVITGILVDNGITAIGAYAFCRLPLVTEISLPGTLTYIGESAFYYDLSLSEVILPDSVTELGMTAFAECHALTRVDFSKNLKTIGPGAFEMVPNLAAIDLPQGVETIGAGAFYGNQAVTELTLPGSLTSFGGELAPFALMVGLKTLTLEEGITAVPDAAFFNCYALETLNLPSTIQTLGAEFVYLGRDGDPSPAQLASITVAGREGYTFNGWVDDTGEPFTNGDIVGRKNIEGVLTALWTKDYGEDTFTDVNEGDWFADYVAFCYTLGLMNGMTDTLFAPDSSATRAQVVTVLWRLVGEPEALEAAPFSDVGEDAWYAGAVAWAAEDEITTGYPDGTFLPDSPVSRQEFLTLLYRFHQRLKVAPAEEPSGDAVLADFRDGDQVADWAADAERWSLAYELQTGVEGDDGLYLNPARSIRRSELAAFLTRFLLALE